MSHDMQTREIGSSGIRASAVGLGTWAIGGWMWGGTDEAASDRGDPGLDRRGRHADRHRARLRHGPLRGDRRQGHRRAPRRGGAGHQMRAGLAHRQRATTSSTRTASRCTATSAASRSPTSWSEPAAARHRPHRPLHHPLAGPDDADRRDDGRAGGPEARRARSGRSAPATSAPADLEAYRRGRAARRDPGAVQHGPPRHRGRARAALPARTASRS